MGRSKRRVTVGLVASRFRRLLPKSEFRAIMPQLKGQGIEIGGPSHVFNRLNRWPIYGLATSLDNVDYSANTIWSQEQQLNRQRFKYREAYVCEATELARLQLAGYDFLISSHVLEHIANPIKALSSWMGVVRPGGLILAVVPHQETTFDHKRPLTALSHLLEDFHNEVGEGDTTHMQEVLLLDDLTRHPEVMDPTTLESRIRENYRHRSIHHHVFDTELLLHVFDVLGLSIKFVDPQLPNHICVAGMVPRHPSGEGIPGANQSLAENRTYFAPGARWRRMSPFESDRRLDPRRLI